MARRFMNSSKDLGMGPWGEGTATAWTLMKPDAMHGRFRGTNLLSGFLRFVTILGFITSTYDPLAWAPGSSLQATSCHLSLGHRSRASGRTWQCIPRHVGRTGLAYGMTDRGGLCVLARSSVRFDDERRKHMLVSARGILPAVTTARHCSSLSAAVAFTGQTRGRRGLSS